MLEQIVTNISLVAYLSPLHRKYTACLRIGSVIERLGSFSGTVLSTQHNLSVAMLQPLLAAESSISVVPGLITP